MKGFIVWIYRANLKSFPFLFPEVQTVYNQKCFLQGPKKAYVDEDLLLHIDP